MSTFRSTFGYPSTSPHLMLGGIYDTTLKPSKEVQDYDHTRRLEAYRRYWQFYLSRHWSYQRDPGEPTITLNYSRRVVDILNDFTFKKGFQVMIPDDPATPTNETDDRDFVRILLQETWRKNNQLIWGVEAGQQGAVSGDLFMRASWDPTPQLEDPFVRIDILPSHLVFPEFGGPYGVDRKRMTKITVINPIYRRIDDRDIAGAYYSRRAKSLQEQYEVVIKSEVWTSAEYNDKGEITVPAKWYKYEDGKEMSKGDNPLGEIPIVHVPNYPLSGEFYGISDLVDVGELNRELNEKTTDISDVINYHGSPVTVVTGAKLADLEKGTNRVWGLPDGATVTNLQLEGDLAAASMHWKQLRTSILELSGTPESALGNSGAISNASGVALHLQYMPLLERRHIKVLSYGLGIRLMNRLIMKITSLKDKEFGKPFEKLGRNRFRNEVVFPDPMPQDEASELEKSRSRITLGLSTRARELERTGLSQAEVSKIVEESAKEREEDALMEFNLGVPAPSMGRGKTQGSRGGNPAVRGQKVSQTAGG